MSVASDSIKESEKKGGWRVESGKRAVRRFRFVNTLSLYLVFYFFMNNIMEWGKGPDGMSRRKFIGTFGGGMIAAALMLLFGKRCCMARVPRRPGRASEKSPKLDMNRLQEAFSEALWDQVTMSLGNMSFQHSFTYSVDNTSSSDISVPFTDIEIQNPWKDEYLETQAHVNVPLWFSTNKLDYTLSDNGKQVDIRIITPNDIVRDVVFLEGTNTEQKDIFGAIDSEDDKKKIMQAIREQEGEFFKKLVYRKIYNDVDQLAEKIATALIEPFEVIIPFLKQTKREFHASIEIPFAGLLPITQEVSLKEWKYKITSKPASVVWIDFDTPYPPKTVIVDISVDKNGDFVYEVREQVDSSPVLRQ